MLHGTQRPPDFIKVECLRGRLADISAGQFEYLLQQRLVATASAFTNPQIVLARIYLRNANEDAALEELHDFLARHPDSPETASVLALVEKIRQARNSDAAPRAGY